MRNYQIKNMDLRDYFAAKAMPIVSQILEDIWRSDDAFQGISNSEFQIIAEACYEFADAMIKASE